MLFLDFLSLISLYIHNDGETFKCYSKPPSSSLNIIRVFSFFKITECGGVGVSCIPPSIQVTMNTDDNSSQQREIRILNPYEYFGERALLLSEPRSANVTADSSVR